MTVATMSDAEQVAAVQAALREAGLEGWLFFDFRGLNPIATSMLGLGWTSRRSFTLIPAEGDPVTLIHAIEHSSWRHWPWGIIDYTGWREMEGRLSELVAGRRRLAMEVFAPCSPNLTPERGCHVIRGNSSKKVKAAASIASQ